MKRPGAVGRTVTVCFVAETDLQSFLVEQVPAVAYRHYSEAYVTAEDRARTARRGL